jgi:hypothetical protein
MRRRTRPDGGTQSRRRALPDFHRLPERVRPEDLVTTQQAFPPEDPRAGRDTETEFLLRNAAF